MTNKEAIEAIKSNYPPSNYSMLREALDMAIEAFEKQIPKKVKKYDYGYTCPNCKKCFTIKGFFDGRNAFCDICSQAIDWSES